MYSAVFVTSVFLWCQSVFDSSVEWSLLVVCEMMKVCVVLGVMLCTRNVVWIEMCVLSGTRVLLLILGEEVQLWHDKESDK